VQHVESGYCSACSGKDKARKAIYQYAQHSFGGLLTGGSGQHLLEDRTHSSRDVPEFPYKCNECGRQFRQASHLMQHKTDKHMSYGLSYVY